MGEQQAITRLQGEMQAARGQVYLRPPRATTSCAKRTAHLTQRLSISSECSRTQSALPRIASEV